MSESVSTSSSSTIIGRWQRVPRPIRRLLGIAGITGTVAVGYQAAPTVGAAFVGTTVRNVELANEVTQPLQEQAAPAIDYATELWANGSDDARLIVAGGAATVAAAMALRAVGREVDKGAASVKATQRQRDQIRRRFRKLPEVTARIQQEATWHPRHPDDVMPQQTRNVQPRVAQRVEVEDMSVDGEGFKLQRERQIFTPVEAPAPAPYGPVFQQSAGSRQDSVSVVFKNNTAMALTDVRIELRSIERSSGDASGAYLRGTVMADRVDPGQEVSIVVDHAMYRTSRLGRAGNAWNQVIERPGAGSAPMGDWKSELEVAGWSANTLHSEHVDVSIGPRTIAHVDGVRVDFGPRGLGL